MDLIKSLIVAFCGSRAIKSIFNDIPKSKPYIPQPVNYNNEKAYLQQINTKVDERNIQITKDDFCSAICDEGKTILKKEFATISKEQQVSILNLYASTNSQPSYLRWRLDLIQKLLSIEYNELGLTQHLVHNELLYIINEIDPKTETELMIKKMCCFIDADYYFVQGDFVSALKRLYETINWDKVLNNEWLQDRLSGNGLETLYQSALLNIINIYALLGLPQKADETRRVFRTIYAQTKQNNIDVERISLESGSGSNKSYMEYIRINDTAFDAASDFIGYCSIRSGSNNEENMFDAFVLGVFGGDQVYNIFPTFYYEVTYGSITNEDSEIVPTLALESIGTITDINRKIEKSRHIVTRLTKNGYFPDFV